MTREIIIAGFGGQGVMSIGKTMTEAGLAENLHVSWLPSYGPEMRGGTANCCVVLSDKPIGSPVVIHPNELIAMNKPSLLKFEPEVQKDGIILINSSIVDIKTTRSDVDSYYIPCLQIASDLGNAKVANMAMLGAYLEATKALKIETVHDMLRHIFYGPKQKLIDINLKAMSAGAACIQ
ncbi:MAG: 2-oxoacid:acceptor oxidoreductase family protein [Candidatus Fimivivens sp.]